MAKVLLVDTNRAAVPLYKYLVAESHNTFVIGSNPLEHLAKICRNYICGDYSDICALQNIIRDEEIKFLVPGCTDLSYQVCSVVNDGQFSNIDSTESFATLNEKNKFREFGDSIGLSLPRVFKPDHIPSKGRIIVKPVDSFSGRGVSILEDASEQQLADAIDRAKTQSKSGSAIIEEFVTGQLYSFSAFIFCSKVVVDFVVREDCCVNPFAVDCSYVDFCFPESILNQLRGSIELLAEKLQLKDGLVHTQFIWNGDRFWIIEVTKRCPGDLYSLLIEYATGYPYAASYARCFLGEKPFPATWKTMERSIIRHTVTTKTEEIFYGFHFFRNLRIHRLFPLATLGDTLGAAPGGRAGILFFEAASEVEREAVYHDLLNGQLYTIHEV